MLDLGINLQLLLGSTVPLPAPYSVVDALVEAEIENKDSDFDGFKLTFSLGKDSLIDYELFLGQKLDPPGRMIIIAIINGFPQVLIDGFITRQEFVSSNQPGESRLYVYGKDITMKLDLEEKKKIYPNQSDSLIATSILTSPFYADLRLIPQITPTTDVPIEVDRVPTQQCTDLAFLQELARRNGFVFYIEPTPVPGVNTAYWGPDNRLGIPQPALTMNMGSETNVASPINFSCDALEPEEPQITIVEPLTKLSIPIPLPGGLRPPLARRQVKPLRKTLPKDTANLNPVQAGLRGLASASGSSDAVKANGEIDSLRYGRALRSRRLVGVRGVGDSYNGNYYVQTVTHRIKRGEYKQSFTLMREGLGTLTPVVVP
ncbi:MAG: hypothetical protein LUQ44_02395 [Methanothrix sp.]|nr:hypothetical protein [Methanothrix sp.]